MSVDLPKLLTTHMFGIVKPSSRFREIYAKATLVGNQDAYKLTHVWTDKATPTSTEPENCGFETQTGYFSGEKAVLWLQEREQIYSVEMTPLENKEAEGEHYSDHATTFGVDLTDHQI